MTPYDPRKAPKYPTMFVLTSEFISVKSAIGVADFRDIKALCYPPTGQYIGCSSDGIMRIGAGSPILRDGIWYIEVDEKSLVENVDPLTLDFKVL